LSCVYICIKEAVSDVARLKKTSMKSKVQFDLNGQNQSVIRAQIIFTDDVRDKVARQFHEYLGYESNIALVNIQPEGVCRHAVSINGSQVEMDLPVKNLEIRTVGGSPTETLDWLKELSIFQLEMIQKNIPSALKFIKSRLNEAEG